MFHHKLSAPDKNTESDKMAVILTMVDYKRAFENQSHILGIQSFLNNGVRKSLIPVLINFYSERKIIVKWKNGHSTPKIVTGGSPQGLTSGILEFLAQSAGNMSFEDPDPNYSPLDPKNV